jgi:hypothetical protein
LNVPASVANAARKGLILIVSAPDPAGRVHKWRSHLGEDGRFLLTAEDGVRYLLPVLDGPAEMIREDLVPTLHFLLARALLEIMRGDDVAAQFFATRLVSVLNENPDSGLNWFDADFLAMAREALIGRHPERFGPSKEPEYMVGSGYDIPLEAVGLNETAPMPSYAKIRNAARPKRSRLVQA